MKYKASRNTLNERYNKIIKIGYCEAQYLLRGMYAVAYNTGIYGWNYDVYEIPHRYSNVAIVTGYRITTPARAVSANYETLKKYENMARDIWNNSDMEYERKRAIVEQMLHEFIEETFSE